MTTSAFARPPIEIETGPQPRSTFIMLHGLGADGSDFAPFASELDLAAVGPVRFVFPHAPLRPVSLNSGFVMPAWFDIHEDRSIEDEAGIRAAQASIETLLAQEKARGVPAERIVLGGFSQGCALTLVTGLRHAERLAGLVGLSGFLPLAASTARERSVANANVPIFLAHGTADEMVIPRRAHAARDTLDELGYPLSWHEYPMGHTVSMEEIRDLNRWLLQVLGARN